MKYIYTILSLALITSCNMPAENQTNNGEPEGSHTSAEWQIWAYSTGAPYVMFEGTIYAHVMYPMAGYYDYQPESAPE